MKKRYNAGLYLRLSVEDAVNSSKRGKGNPFQNESTSIENQRDILIEYIHLSGWSITKVYTDDGYSGGSFNRPAFQEMIRDARVGVIDLILVKDLSRLGRDHLEVDHYVEDVFPALGVRFIALMDGIDSEGSADILPFRSLLNDYHLKDLSRKTKSVLHAKAKAGDYVGAFAPYGYKKNPAKHGRLIVDPYAAEVVRRIFDLRLQRIGFAKIAATLNKDGILAPQAYRYESEGKPNPFNVATVWQDRIVKLILKNEVYLGHSVKMKKGTFSYKIKKQVNRPVEDWIRAENTHEAIITQEIWDAVQSIDLKRHNPQSQNIPELSLFSGLLQCDNGHPMFCNTGTKHYRGGTQKYRAYYCSLHKKTGGTECSRHTIPEPALIQIVREDIQRQLKHIEVDKDRIVADIQSRLTKVSLEDTAKELKSLSIKLDDLDIQVAKLYEDRLKKIINLNTFISLSASLDKERSEIQSKHEQLSKAFEIATQQIHDTEQWIFGIRSYLSMETPDRDTLCKIIDKIVISEREGSSIGKERRQAITIVYRFVGYVG